MQNSIVIDPALTLIILLAIFSLLVLYAVAHLIGAVLWEGSRASARREKHKTGRKGRRGLGLRFKLGLFTVVLVLMVIFMVSTPLYYMMNREQHTMLLKGLWNRSAVLLEGIAASAGLYLRSGDITELKLLPSRIAAIPEAVYITITGSNDRVWATNDPGILLKIDTPYLQLGVSLLNDGVSPGLEAIRQDVNIQAIRKLGRIPRLIRDLEQLGGAEAEIATLEADAALLLGDITWQIGCEPRFVFNYLPRNERFLLYKPLVFLGDSEANYFHGLVRLEISLDSIIVEIKREQALLERTILIISFAVLTIGVIGALLLSSLIIRPIQKLVRHVELIRDTEEKKNLANMEIHIASRDEIAMLGDTINEMTQRLAAAESDLSISREIQKKFLPLELDRDGNKLSCGYKDAENAVFFGYYAGAGGVSGDYFDYQELDGGYYAIIKCDVAGKGIPAALIMIQVATMFLNYFKQWKPLSGEMNIEKLVYQINDFIETLGYRERFAAFTLCIFDSETGDLHFCNAGDNIIHIFDSSERCIKDITLPQTPAAGVLPHSVVESKGGYQVQTFYLDHGDILLLYTDGIEESKRKFRDSSFNETACTGGPAGTLHDTHVAGEWNEEMGQQRVYGIVNAVMNRGEYCLHKWHSSEGEGDMYFDFSGCEGGLDDLIMALIAAEKMFRCYYDSRAARGEWVLVEKKIDAFLKNHFLLYDKYCAETCECPDNDLYIYYTHLREDQQYDDLAILGVKRK